MFLGGRDRVHWERMGQWFVKDVEVIKEMKILKFARGWDRL